VIPPDLQDKKVYITIIAIMLLYNAIDIGLYFFSAALVMVVALSQLYPLALKSDYQGEKTDKKRTTLPLLLAGFALASGLLLWEAISEDYRAKAEISRSQNDLNEAVNYYKKSMAIFPFNYKAMIGCATIKFYQAYTSEAEFYLDKALNLSPASPFANFIKSRIEYKNLHPFRALYHATIAFNTNPLNRNYQKWYTYLKRNLETSFIQRGWPASKVPPEGGHKP